MRDVITYIQAWEDWRTVRYSSWSGKKHIQEKLQRRVKISTTSSGHKKEVFKFLILFNYLFFYTGLFSIYVSLYSIFRSFVVCQMLEVYVYTKRPTSNSSFSQTIEALNYCTSVMAFRWLRKVSYRILDIFIVTLDFNLLFKDYFECSKCWWRSSGVCFEVRSVNVPWANFASSDWLLQ